MTFLVLYCRVLTALTALMALLARIWTIVVTEVLSWRACENFQVSAATSVFAMSCLRIDPTFFSKRSERRPSDVCPFLPLSEG